MNEWCGYHGLVMIGPLRGDMLMNDWVLDYPYSWRHPYGMVALSPHILTLVVFLIFFIYPLYCLSRPWLNEVQPFWRISFCLFPPLMVAHTIAMIDGNKYNGTRIGYGYFGYTSVNHMVRDGVALIIGENIYLEDMWNGLIWSNVPRGFSYECGYHPT